MGEMLGWAARFALSTAPDHANCATRLVSRMTNNRAQVVAAFVAGAMLIAVAVVVYGTFPPKDDLSLTQKKALLRQAARQQILTDSFKWGATTVTDDNTAEGNIGKEWNYGQNFGGLNANALSRGWMSGADTAHDNGVGMFGKFGVDPSLNGPGVYDEPALENGVKKFSVSHCPSGGDALSFHWILGPYGDSCTKGCEDANMQCSGSFPTPSSAAQADCMFEAAGYHCSSEADAHPGSQNDILFYDTVSFDPSVDDGICYWHSNGQTCDAKAPGHAQRLCGCTK